MSIYPSYLVRFIYTFIINDKFRTTTITTTATTTTTTTTTVYYY